MNTALTELKCHKNLLVFLKVSKNTALKVLKCYKNELTNLDVSKNTALTELDCSQNKINSLDLRMNAALTQLKSDFSGLKPGGSVFDVEWKTYKSAFSKYAAATYLSYIVLVIVSGILTESFWFTVISLFWGFIIIGVILYQMDYRTEVEIKKRIDEGDLIAQIELGVFLMDAAGSAESLKKAKVWIEKAVGLGIKDAQTKLNECIEKIAEKEREEAEKEAKSSRRSNAPGMYTLRTQI